MVVVLIIGLGIVGCALATYFGPVIFPDRFYEKGEQIFQGIPNGTLLMYKLNLNGFNPRWEAGDTEARVYYSPYCGAMNSTEANRSQSVMGQSFITLDYGNNTTLTRLDTREFVNSEYISHNISGTLRCVMEKTKAILTTELSLKFVSEHTSKQKAYLTPGFETILMVPVIMVISLIWRKRMRGQKK